MKLQKKEAMRESQDKTYADPSKWHVSTLVSTSGRLYCALRYAKILEAFGVLKEDSMQRKIKILEPGCGVGSVSSALSVFGKVWGFDYSSEAIKTARALFGDSAIFFEADGTSPLAVKEIAGERFDCIIIKEFHPLSRNIADGRKPLEIVEDYYSMLRAGGVMVIENSQSPFNWRRFEGVLQTSGIVKRYKADVFFTLSLDMVLPARILIRSRAALIVLSRLLDPAVFLYCLIRGSNLSKTTVILKI